MIALVQTKLQVAGRGVNGTHLGSASASHRGAAAASLRDQSEPPYRLWCRPDCRGCRVGLPLRRGLQQQLRWSDDEHDGEVTTPLPTVDPRIFRLSQLPTAGAEPWTEVRSTTLPLRDREWRDTKAWAELIAADTAKGTALRQLRDALMLTAPAAQQWLALFQHHQDAHHLRQPELWPSIHITPATLLSDLMDGTRTGSIAPK